MTYPADAVRGLFLDFFSERDHLVLPSSSLVPTGDSSVLFTSAGMQQFKRYYSGAAVPPRRRLATSQKCFRTSDIESVGDASHLTFFEMLGNFAFGDYFKRESILWAYQLLTERVGLDPERIWITCFGGEGNLPRDLESYRIWRDEIGIPEERIEFHGRSENFWGPTGDSGPCGPDTEIHYRLRPPPDGLAESGTTTAGDRFIELWNLVFNQFEQDAEGRLHDLPSHGVDTGAGFERWVVLMQDKRSVYETDLYLDIVREATAVLRPDRKNHDHVRALRTVAEHARALTFLIADGVLPSNDGRGFVLRRLLRRAVGAARGIGASEPLMARVCLAAIETMQAVYPEVGERSEQILAVVADEEDRFAATLRGAIGYLDRRVVGQTKSGRIDGSLAFWLHDTLGLTIENLKSAAAARDLTVDEAGFEKALAERQQRSRESARSDLQLPGGLPSSRFSGYQSLIAEQSRIEAIFVEGKPVDDIRAPQKGLLVLSATPFYAEAGGQVGDTGEIFDGFARAEVGDTQKNPEGTIFHRAAMTGGGFAVGQSVSARVNGDRRLAICRNHTATHLLHLALRQVLGEHARQAGSLVAEDHLRFDFKFDAALSPDQLGTVEQLVNEAALAGLPVKTQITEVQAAVAQGAMALFGETYGEAVRMVQIGRDSLELCGGTHLANTANLGLLHVTGQANVGSGLRRIEAVTGRAAAAQLRLARDRLMAIARQLDANPTDLPDAARRLLNERTELTRQNLRLRELRAANIAAALLASEPEMIGSTRVLGGNVETDELTSLAEISSALKSRMGRDCAFLVTGLNDGSAQVLAAASSGAVSAGADASAAIRAAARQLGGGGGGNRSQARGGGPKPEGTAAALVAGLQVLREQLQRSG